VLVVVALLAAGCGDDDPSVTSAQADDFVVVTALWPLAELAQEIGGDDVVVVNLTPVGESPHELDLTARQRDEVAAADLAIVVGGGFQRDVEGAAAAAGEVLSIVDDLALEAGHVWLDPTVMGSIATAIGEALDTEGAAARAEDLVEELVELDARIAEVLATCERDTIVTQHDAFGPFAARYGLTAVGLDAAMPDDDPAPDPALLDEVEGLIDDGAVTTLFTEPLQPPSWVEVLAEERGLDTVVLDPYEGLTIGDDARELHYEEAMLDNLRVLREALECSST